MHSWTGCEAICQPEVALAPFTWYKLGGPAEWFAAPRNEAELSLVLQRCAENGLPWRILGGGANLLVRDQGVRGVVIRLDGETFCGAGNNGSGRRWALQPNADGRSVTLGGGADLTRLTKHAAMNGWGGFERLAGIPGTVGGAVTMNAGGRWGCIGDLVRSVALVDPDGRQRTVSAAELGFEYRRTRVGERIVSAAVLEYTPDEPRRTWQRYLEVWNAKYASQPPVSERSAGCIFKNPPGQSAGALIDRAGLKGARRGGAEVSHRHANFIVAQRDATAADVLALIDAVRETVARECGVVLELEIVVW